MWFRSLGASKHAGQFSLITGRPASYEKSRSAFSRKYTAGRITVTLREDGSVFYGPQPVRVEDLSALVAQSKAVNAALKVYVRADAKVPFKEVRGVFTAAAAGGVPNVVFATFQSDK